VLETTNATPSKRPACRIPLVYRIGRSLTVGTFRTNRLPVNSGILFVRIIDRPLAAGVLGKRRYLDKTALEIARIA
jgi:hypothetical protein